MELLSSLGDMNAAEGFPVVLLSGLQMLGALALIVGVLIVMDIVYKKKHPDWKNEPEESEKKTEETSESEENKE